MNVRGSLPIRRVINSFGAVGYSLLICNYLLICAFAVMWLVRRGYLASLGLVWRPVAAAPEVAIMPASDPQLLSVRVLGRCWVLRLCW